MSLETDSRIVYITGKNIDGLDTRLTDLCSYLKPLLNNPFVNEYICIAGGFILDAVSKRSYGHLLQQSDIDIWVLNNIVSSESRNVSANNDIVSAICEWCQCGTNVLQNTSGSILYTKCKTTGREIQIINTELYTLEQILLSFDNPACQVGIKLTSSHDLDQSLQGLQRIQIVCTSDFLRCMEAGEIDWWNSGNFDRLYKYGLKGFSYPEWMHDFHHLSEIYSRNTIDRVARVPWNIGTTAFTGTIKQTYGSNSWQLVNPDMPFSMGNMSFAGRIDLNGLFDTLASGDSWFVGNQQMADMVETTPPKIKLRISVQESVKDKLKNIFKEICIPYLKSVLSVPLRCYTRNPTDIDIYIENKCHIAISERGDDTQSHITMRLNSRTVIVSDECSWTGTSLDPWTSFFQNRTAFRLRVWATIQIYNNRQRNDPHGAGIILTARVIHIIRHGSKTKRATRQYDIDYT